ncbi:acetoin dehydrogenase [Virgisporangium aliadipatigenens]|uniref:Acetoin dehydrogenase n=1 Tax=Virgisporangium aliadipatigenens TaxID=741659 RepID=A0A8J3YSF7_9ACTN|nr:SDR family NAD(P)-dependent oxidoreductase [Virgisporangium aliadipatigenens]GIJ49040.1 acetoin dehydrogenase [Virgisporangium aliadipatigenens]
MKRFRFPGGTAVVTGAASGIGAALAAELASRGMRLVLLDRDAAGLARVHSGLSDVDVTTHVVDLSDAAAISAVAQRVPDVRLLVNNAGVALAGRFDEVTLEEFDWLIAVNFRAVVHLTHALLPALKAEPGSHLVTVSSLFGLIAPGGQAAYSASKFAVRGFTEALRRELTRDAVGVSVVHPGGIRTRIAANARVGSGVDRAELVAGLRRIDRLLRMPPERAAQIIARGVERRNPRILIGADARLLDLASRAWPRRVP